MAHKKRKNKKPVVKILGHINHEGEKIPIVRLVGGDHLAIMEFDRAIEDSGLDVWIRESRDDIGETKNSLMLVRVLAEGVRGRMPVELVRLN